MDSTDEQLREYRQKQHVKFIGNINYMSSSELANRLSKTTLGEQVRYETDIYDSDSGYDNYDSDSSYDDSDSDDSDSSYETKISIENNGVVSINQYLNKITTLVEDELQSKKHTQSRKTIPERKRKKNIPLTVKKLVWNKYIGEDIGKSKCYCCKLTEITQMSFHCGHVISEKDGGEIMVDNLRPICQSCNSSMGARNMNEFIDEFKL